MTADRTGARGNAGSFRSSADSLAADPTARDYYAVLGVAPEASAEEVRAAYLALMKRYHPDRGSGRADGTAAAAINRAMAVLGDPPRRRAYDRSRRPPASAEPRIYPLVVVPARRGIPRGPALAIIAGAVALVLVVARLAPATPSPAAYAEPAEPPVDRLLVQTMMQQASVDLEWIALYNGASGAERFSRNCYAELAQATSLPLLLFCGAIDARGARLFPRQQPYFATGQRQARFVRAASLLSLPIAGLWRRMEAEARVLHDGTARAAAIDRAAAARERVNEAPIDILVDP